MNFFAVPEPGPSESRIDEIRALVARRLALPEDAAVMVTELRCTEPDCPPIETVIAILRSGEQPRKLTLHKPVGEIEDGDIENLLSDSRE